MDVTGLLETMEDVVREVDISTVKRMEIEAGIEGEQGNAKMKLVRTEIGWGVSLAVLDFGEDNHFHAGGASAREALHELRKMLPVWVVGGKSAALVES